MVGDSHNEDLEGEDHLSGAVGRHHRGNSSSSDPAPRAPHNHRASEHFRDTARDQASQNQSTQRVAESFVTSRCPASFDDSAIKVYSTMTLAPLGRSSLISSHTVRFNDLDWTGAVYTGSRNLSGQRHGHGTLEVACDPFAPKYRNNPTYKLQYTGDWENDKMHGEGTLHMVYDAACGFGYKYDGCFENGTKHGEGKLTFFVKKDVHKPGVREHDTYTGAFKHDHFNGQDGLWHGQGCFTFGSGNGAGNQYSGVFDRGVLKCGMLEYGGEKTGRRYTGNFSYPR
eukprot:gene39369-48650_t